VLFIIFVVKVHICTVLWSIGFNATFSKNILHCNEIYIWNRCEMFIENCQIQCIKRNTCIEMHQLSLTDQMYHVRQKNCTVLLLQ